MSIPRLVIAGTHSGVGKTTIATAVMAALARRGLRVQPFKIGPDFIDPSYHEAACRRASRNLDGWMLSRETNLALFSRAARDADIAVIEGVMGVFDARTSMGEDGSTAQMAKWLDAPVLLVADASGVARSAAALIGGYESFDPDLLLDGVIFNRAGSARHGALLQEALSGFCRTPFCGALPRDESVMMPSRHLGLTLARETFNDQRLAQMADWIERHLDLNGLIDVARARHLHCEAQGQPSADRTPIARIAVARDEAFCFYYEDNLELLTACGAELVPFSPIHDSNLPEGAGGLYLGGGYPELHAEKLAANTGMLARIRAFAAAGRPVYAECGGFMYLTEGMVDREGREHKMAGVFPTVARMQPRLARLGYAQPKPTDNALWAAGSGDLRGHEFRYSTIDPMPVDVPRAYEQPTEGYSIHAVLGSYVHLHFLASPRFAERFIEQCAVS